MIPTFLVDPMTNPHGSNVQNCTQNDTCGYTVSALEVIKLYLESELEVAKLHLLGATFP